MSRVALRTTSGRTLLAYHDDTPYLNAIWDDDLDDDDEEPEHLTLRRRVP